MVAHFTDPEQPGGQGAQINQGLEFYNQVKERKQIRALTWRRLDKKPADATFLLYRLPDSRGQTRLNICARFGARSADLPTRRIVHADLTGLLDEVEEPVLM